jgi:hypothetical protein
MGLADRLDGLSETRVYPDGTVVRVAIRRTDSDAYPSGWRYTMHYGRLVHRDAATLEDGTILRFDNAHEATKGHERHCGRTGKVERIEFDGIEGVWTRFWEAVPKDSFGSGEEV